MPAQSSHSCTRQEAADEVPLVGKIFVQQELGKLGLVTTVPAEQGQLMRTGKLTGGGDINDFLSSSSPVPDSSRSLA